MLTHPLLFAVGSREDANTPAISVTSSKMAEIVGLATSKNTRAGVGGGVFSRLLRLIRRKEAMEEEISRVICLPGQSERLRVVPDRLPHRIRDIRRTGRDATAQF